VLGDPALGRRRRAAMLRLAGGTAAVAAGLFLLPAPRSVVAEGVLWVAPEAELRAGEDGLVQAVLTPDGAVVEAGAPLLALASPELEAEWAAQAARVAELEVRAEAERASDRVRAALTDGELQRERAALQVLATRRAALQARAGSAGRLQLLRAADLPARPVARGDLLGYVDAPAPPRVRAVVGQDDIGLVRGGARRVEVRLVDAPGEAIAAELLRGAAGGESRLPARALSHAGGGPWATDPSDDDGLRTLERVFAVEIALAQRPPAARIGTRALVKFELAPEALGLQAWRRLRQLFLTRLEL
jgi:putative peptide zinc metalloprotease protein